MTVTVRDTKDHHGLWKTSPYPPQEKSYLPQDINPHPDTGCEGMVRRAAPPVVRTGAARYDPVGNFGGPVWAAAWPKRARY